MRPSRCLDASNAPQTIHWAVLGGDPKVVSEELLTAIRDSVRADRLVDAVADIQALLERVEMCVANDPEDVVPVARHQELWELRLNDQASGTHIRIYCAEVGELPHTMVALHAHAKFTRGPQRQIKRKQDEAISLAILRLEAGRRDLWGLGRSATPS